MNKMSYFKWFLAKGWRKYIAPFLLLCFLDYKFIASFNGLIESGEVFATILAAAILSLANAGLIYHSIDAYKNRDL